MSSWSELKLVAELPLVGAGGEPADFARTIVSHGVAELPPNHVDLEARTFVTTLSVPGGARTVRVYERNGSAAIELVAGRSSGTVARVLKQTVQHMLRLDEDLSSFYALCREDPDLGWCRRRRADASQPERVRGRRQDDLHDEHGVVGHTQDDRGPRRQPRSRSAGYRGTYLKQLASDVAAGTVDLEALNDPELPDDEVAARLLALPGVGPYAAAHVMLTCLGRYSRLVLDSWTRPDVRQAHTRAKAGEGHDDRTALPPLRRVGGARVLAVLDAELGRRRRSRVVTLPKERPGPVAQPVFKTGEAWQPHAGQVRLLCRSVSRCWTEHLG